jgi:hypothetical protein
MRTAPIHLLGKFFAILTLVCFFLPWVRVSPAALRKNTLEVVKNLSGGEKGVLRTMVWMRSEEWGEMWADPADGFSGFQLAFGAASGTPRARAQQELASVVLDKKENRPLLGWLLLIPVLTGLGWFGWSLPRVPPVLLGLTAVGLTGMYLTMRWQMSDAYTDRLLAQLQLGPGWWGTVYGMLGLAVVSLVYLVQSRGGRYGSKVTML